MSAKPNTAQNADLFGSTGRLAGRVSVEPSERDDPLNAVLDLVETALRTALDLGLAAQIKARLARMVELAPEEAAIGNRHSAIGAGTLGEGARLLIANAASLVAEHAKRARTEPVRERHKAVVAGLNELIECRMPNAECRTQGDQ